MPQTCATQSLGANAFHSLVSHRYTAICHPLRAQTVCTVARAKRIIAGIWGVTSLYCLLWFFLVDLNVRDNQRLECGYKVPRGLYLPIYLLDFTVFFIGPLLVTLVLYGLIGRILFQNPLSQEAWQKERQPHGQSEAAPGDCSRAKSSRKQVRGPPRCRWGCMWEESQGKAQVCKRTENMQCVMGKAGQ